MRVEKREVTKFEEVFIADDGTEFENEYDCIEYDVTLKEKSFKMLYSDFDICTEFDGCKYVILETLDQVKEFVKVCKYYGVSYEGLDANLPGIYMYTDERRGDTWLNLSVLIDRINFIFKGEEK